MDKRKERMVPMERLERELTALLNRHSKENESNTPDFILTDYLLACLGAFNRATQQRETWYGRDARPSQPFTALSQSKRKRRK